MMCWVISLVPSCPISFSNRGAKYTDRGGEGVPLNKVRVVTESNGDLVTAFPQSTFRDLKSTDTIFLRIL